MTAGSDARARSCNARSVLLLIRVRKFGFIDQSEVDRFAETYLKGVLSSQDRIVLADPPAGLRYHDHQIDHGPLFHRLACEHRLEGIVSNASMAATSPTGDPG